MSAPQKTYKIYSYDSAHRVVTADMIDAMTDDEAIAIAERAGFGSKCEIWHGRRLVAQLEAERRQA
jgi:hypothetical protein